MLVLAFFSLVAASGAEKNGDGYPSVTGKKVVISVTQGGKERDQIPAEFSADAIASPWFSKHGFNASLPLVKGIFDGSMNRRTSYSIQAENGKGEKLMINITIFDKKQGGNLSGSPSGSLSLIRSDGEAKNFGLAAEKVITK